MRFARPLDAAGAALIQPEHHVKYSIGDKDNNAKGNSSFLW
jgi:hypothetical protein